MKIHIEIMISLSCTFMTWYKHIHLEGKFIFANICLNYYNTKHGISKCHLLFMDKFYTQKVFDRTTVTVHDNCFSENNVSTVKVINDFFGCVWYLFYKIKTTDHLIKSSDDTVHIILYL